MRRRKSNSEAVLILVSGTMCTGKSTLAKRLCDGFRGIGVKVQCVFVGTLIREIQVTDTPLGREINSYISSNVTIPFDIVNRIIVENLPSDCQVVILEGVPRSIEQVLKFDFLYSPRTLSVNLHGISFMEVFNRLRGRKICSECHSIFQRDSCVKCGGKDYTYRQVNIRRWSRENSVQNDPYFQLYLDRKKAQGTGLCIDTSNLQIENTFDRCWSWLEGIIFSFLNDS